jgi:hypothetical protein
MIGPALLNSGSKQKKLAIFFFICNPREFSTALPQTFPIGDDARGF